MSTLYLGSDPRSHADRLADELERQARDSDFFAPTLIVVPNRYMRKWLRLWLARRLDVAINLDFHELEDALWLLLHEVDPDRSPSPPEPIDENIYRLLVLAVLLEEQEPFLAPLQQYLQMQGTTLNRLSCRRAWVLAQRLGYLLQEYEYHRQDPLIQRWLQHQFGLGGASEFHKMMERAQRALFLHITREPDGKRALLNRLGGGNYKTFPQYAMDVMTRPDPPAHSGRIVHFFGFTQMSELHTKTIAWLGELFDIRYHHLNILANRLEEPLSCTAIQGFAEVLPGAGDDEARDRGRSLVRWWGRAGAESLWLTAQLLSGPAFTAEVIPPYEPPPRPAGRRTGRRINGPRGASTLKRLQDHLLGNQAPRTRLSQDTTLQILGCPGRAREVETVYNSILHNLAQDSSLRQTDIAVLVTDMPRYRATLQAVFERPPRHLQFNMVDFSAAGISMLGQALLGMLDLALESFSRSRVFQVILNPCFLARLGVDRAQAMVWLEWAESLGIYQGWDADEKQQQGYPSSPFYAWRLGLQRLRLGRYMEVCRDDAEQPAPRFGHVIPFADLACTDREHLDAFCKAVEGLLPALARLRSAHTTGQRWAHLLQRLVQEFLDVPEDRPEEAHVHDELLAALEKLAAWDSLHDSTHRSPGLPLALVREYVQSQLEVLEGNHGEYLIGGVTISALQPMRPVPFQIIYVLGLEEDLFPGSNALSSFDLRGAQRIPGDIRPAEHRLYDFLTTVLAAQQKLYLLYNNHDLVKDQPLQPAVTLHQLQRYLSRHVLKSDFQQVELPLHADDPRFLDPAQQPAYQDVLVQYGDADRCLAILAAEREGRVALNLTQQAEWSEKLQEFATNFSIAPSPLQTQDSHAVVAASSPANQHALFTSVTLSELRRFLRFPAYESLRRHLHVEEDEEQALVDEEPLVTPEQAARALVRQTIQQLVLAAGQGGAQDALATWQARFAETYADSRLRCRVPEEAFGEIDQASLARELQERIHGQGNIEQFLRQHADTTFCGPVLVGTSLTPLGARLRFPALRLRPGQELPADAPQEIRLAGWTHFAWQSPNRFEILIVTNSKQIDGREISLAMMEPLLLHLAMLANGEPNADGTSPQEWLVGREFLLHVAHCGGIQTWTYPAGAITPAEALHYLIELIRDFLDPKQFDLLPFELLCKNKEMCRAYDAASVFQISPDGFRKQFEEIIADARENSFSNFEVPLLVDMIHAQVPADALAKVQRRFRLLDRGPARLRQQPSSRGRKR